MRDSIDKFLEGMRERRLANEKVLAETAAERDEEGPGEREDPPLLPGPS